VDKLLKGFSLLLAVCYLPPAGRNYHPIGVAEFAKENPQKWSRKLHTHVQVEGFITYMKAEEDGDLHVRVCETAGVKGMDRSACIVAEFIPTMGSTSHAKNHLRTGQRVRIEGISRFDAEPGHMWWEVHPVELVAVVP
jgi:hypothetical protein